MSLSTITFPCASYTPTANADTENDNAVIGMMNSACQRIKDNFVLPNTIPIVTLVHGSLRALLQGAGSSFDMHLTADMEGGFPTGMYYASIQFPGDLRFSDLTNRKGADIYCLIELIKEAETAKINEWVDGV